MVATTSFSRQVVASLLLLSSLCHSVNGTRWPEYGVSKGSITSMGTTDTEQWRTKQRLPIATRQPSGAFLPPTAVAIDRLRGGSTAVMGDDSSQDEDEGVEEEDEETRKRRLALWKYHSDQQVLLQIRGTLLSETLAQRGLPMTTTADIANPTGGKKPEIVDWECTMTSEDNKKVRWYCMEDERWRGGR